MQIALGLPPTSRGYAVAVSAKYATEAQWTKGDFSLVQIDYYGLASSPTVAGALGVTHTTSTVLNRERSKSDYFVEGGAAGNPGGSKSVAAAAGAASGSGTLGDLTAAGRFGRASENLAHTAVASQIVTVPRSTRPLPEHRSM